MSRGVVMAGTHSGCGKTTLTLGLLAALMKKGFKALSFKAGPDFIDPGLHRLITGRPSRNLDIWMCGEDYVQDCFRTRSMCADISVIEGVMGMYDGEFSTASLADLLNLPVILVVDAYGMAESAGAVVKGFAGSAKCKNAKLAGVIFSRVASARHYERLKDSVRDIQVFGYLPRDQEFEIPHRHLGLTVAEENPISPGNIDRLAEAVLNHVDVNAILDRGSEVISQGAAIRNPEKQSPTSPPCIAVAYDRAFCFYYEDNLDLLRDAGAEIVRFSPITDSKIPDCADAVYIGGGYPELYARELSENTSMRKAVRNWADSGNPLYAECGGLMYLSHGIHDFNGDFFRMAAVFPFEMQVRRGRPYLGYREIVLKDDCILGNGGERLRGHEFHYSEIRDWKQNRENRTGEKIYSVKESNGNPRDEGYRFKNTLASYVHVHFGSNPGIARNFIHIIKGKRWRT